MKVNKQWKLQGLRESTALSPGDWDICDTWEQGSCPGQQYHWLSCYLRLCLLSSTASYPLMTEMGERLKNVNIFKTYIHLFVSMPWHVCGSQREACRNWFSASIQVGLSDQTQVTRLSGKCLDHILQNQVAKFWATQCISDLETFQGTALWRLTFVSTRLDWESPGKLGRHFWECLWGCFQRWLACGAQNWWVKSHPKCGEHQ